MPSSVENIPVVLEKKTLKAFNNVFLLFCNYLQLEKGVTHHLKNKILNHLHLSMLCAKFGWKWPSGSGEEDFKSCQFIFIISLLSPLWEGPCPSFEQTWIPFTQGYFVPSLVETDPVVLEKKMKMWTVYRQMDRRTDDEQ